MTVGHSFSFHPHSHGVQHFFARTRRILAAVLKACRRPVEFVLLPLGILVILLMLVGNPHPWMLRSVGISGTPDDVLLAGIKGGNPAWISAGLHRGASPNAADQSAMTALMWAASAGDAPLVRRLIADGADIAAESLQGTTALSMAAELEEGEIVQILLSAGAEVDQPLRIGTALHHAAARGQPRTVDALLRAGADPNARGHSRQTPLVQVLYTQYPTTEEVARLLLAAGADVDAADELGRTALMQASEDGRIALVRLLLEAQADPTLTDREGKTAADLAGDNERILAALSCAASDQR